MSIRSDNEREPPGDAVDDAVPVQAWARSFVALLLTGFVVCGLFGVEAWPFSGFRLFSAPRLSTWSSFHGEMIDPDGGVSRLRVASLPTAYRGFGLMASRLSSQPGPDRRAVCRAYANAALAAGVPVEELGIYRDEHDVLPRDGTRPTTPVASTLLTRCVPGDVP